MIKPSLEVFLEYVVNELFCGFYIDVRCGEIAFKSFYLLSFSGYMYTNKLKNGWLFLLV